MFLNKKQTYLCHLTIFEITQKQKRKLNPIFDKIRYQRNPKAQ